MRFGLSQRQLSNCSPCVLHLLSQKRLILQHLLHDLRAKVQLRRHLLLILVDLPHFGEQQIDALLHLLPPMLITLLFIIPPLMILPGPVIPMRLIALFHRFQGFKDVRRLNR